MKKIGIKILQVLGTLILSNLFGYLFWLFFYWATPYVMGASWLMFIVYLFVAGGFVTFVSSIVTYLPTTALYFLTRNNITAKLLNFLALSAFGVDAIINVWSLNMDYGFLQWILGIMMTMVIAKEFILAAVAPFNQKSIEEEA